MRIHRDGTEPCGEAPPATDDKFGIYQTAQGRRRKICSKSDFLGGFGSLKHGYIHDRWQLRHSPALLETTWVYFGIMGTSGLCKMGLHVGYSDVGSITSEYSGKKCTDTVTGLRKAPNPKSMHIIIVSRGG